MYYICLTAAVVAVYVLAAILYIYATTYMYVVAVVFAIGSSSYFTTLCSCTVIQLTIQIGWQYNCQQLPAAVLVADSYRQIYLGIVSSSFRQIYPSECRTLLSYTSFRGRNFLDSMHPFQQLACGDVHSVHDVHGFNASFTHLFSFLGIWMQFVSSFYHIVDIHFNTYFQ